MAVRYEKGDDRVVTLTFDAPGAPVNTMTREWQAAFAAAVGRLEQEKEQIAGVILASAKRTFFAGAELKDVLQYGPADGPKVFEWIEAAKAQFRKLERLGKPVVACLEGAALGGGWELALAAHCRICLNEERIELGLPEATLGLLPGAGGVTKTVRLLGLQAALPLLVEGKTMRPADAAKLGLLQGLAANREDLFRMAREWIAKNPAPKQPWDEENHRIPGGTPSTPAISQMLTLAPAMLIEKTRGLFPAPEAIMAAAVEGASVDFDTALRI
jgi:3-hydroxyacyl-CoA dehydrogenase/enoyl-CoA hydratase/3-hydroxybutyryl-CoA epimerase